jgi:20S proteasome subunit beta 1
LLLLSTTELGSAASNEVSLGTTLVAVTYKDGVVVGADTRTSVGSYVSNRYAEKIASVLNMAVICRSGSAADTQYLAEQLGVEFQSRYYRYGEKPKLTQIAHLLRSMVTESMSASLICAGYQEGAGHIYAITPNGSILKEESGFAVSGSGSTFILGHLDNFYRKDMEEQEAIDFVVNAVQLAINRDGSSGGFVRIHVVNQDGSQLKTIYPDHNKPLSTIAAKSQKLTGFALPIRSTKRK